jgi:hypothetical protein
MVIQYPFESLHHNFAEFDENTLRHRAMHILYPLPNNIVGAILDRHKPDLLNNVELLGKTRGVIFKGGQMKVA